MAFCLSATRKPSSCAACTRACSSGDAPLKVVSPLSFLSGRQVWQRAIERRNIRTFRANGVSGRHWRYCTSASVRRSGWGPLGLADDLQYVLTELLRPIGEEGIFTGGEAVVGVSHDFLRTDEDFLHIAGFFPLLLVFIEIERLTIACIASAWISGSCSQAVPATLNFRNFMQLLVNVPVLSEKM